MRVSSIRSAIARIAATVASVSTKTRRMPARRLAATNCRLTEAELDTATRKPGMRPWVGVGILTLCTATPAIGGPWNPKLQFSIEGGRYDETLLFVSGVAYALAYSARELDARREPNFFCLPPGRILDAKLLVDLLNPRLAGPQTADALVNTATAELSQEYPCKDRHAASRPGERGRRSPLDDCGGNTGGVANT